MTAPAVRAGSRTITTHAELDELFDGNTTLVRGRDGQVWERSGTRWDCLSDDGAAGLHPTSSIALPALLLFVPGEEVIPPAADPGANIVEQAARLLAAVDGVKNALTVPDGSLALFMHRMGAQTLAAAGLLIPGPSTSAPVNDGRAAAAGEPDTSPPDCAYCGQDHPSGTACPPLEFPGTEWDQ